MSVEELIDHICRIRNLEPVAAQSLPVEQEAAQEDSEEEEDMIVDTVRLARSAVGSPAPRATSPELGEHFLVPIPPLVN